jgi:hypothetical protein
VSEKLNSFYPHVIVVNVLVHATSRSRNSPRETKKTKTVRISVLSELDSKPGLSDTKKDC